MVARRTQGAGPCLGSVFGAFVILMLNTLAPVPVGASPVPVWFSAKNRRGCTSPLVCHKQEGVRQEELATVLSLLNSPWARLSKHLGNRDRGYLHICGFVAMPMQLLMV